MFYLLRINIGFSSNIDFISEVYMKNELSVPPGIGITRRLSIYPDNNRVVSFNTLLYNVLYIFIFCLHDIGCIFNPIVARLFISKANRSVC